MMAAGAVEVRLVRAHDAWDAAGDADSLAALLEVIHQDAPASLAALADVGLDLERLRRAWRQCAPDQAPLDD